MADDMVLLQCEACSTRLKVRAVTARIMKDVKCPKCGQKVPTKNVVAPAESAPVAAPAPAPVPAPDPAATPPPAPVVEKSAEPAAPVVAAPPVVDDTELKLARARVTELEQQVADLNARVRALSVPPPAEAELAQARVIIAEQEERLTQLQQLWYEKEKETRTAVTTAQRAQQERKQALDQIEALLKSYHEAEIEAATDRINNLNVRLQNFMAQLAAKSTAG